MSLVLCQQLGEALLLGLAAFVAGEDNGVCEGGLNSGRGK